MHKIINICYFLCGLNKFEQKNQLSVLDKEKIEEYQKTSFKQIFNFQTKSKH
ncbi:hypothetical protein [Borreliella garinii]|uniref:hypothetical protein n=1 Tax=Borreliella garinii TaxID=29519 RepID=UPI001376C035|nr:hypothetical protein [Borreliella garinii]